MIYSLQKAHGRTAEITFEDNLLMPTPTAYVGANEVLHKWRLALPLKQPIACTFSMARPSESNVFARSHLTNSVPKLQRFVNLVNASMDKMRELTLHGYN